VLPPDAKLSAGVANFSATLNTVGLQTISATDLDNSSIKGTTANIVVTGSDEDVAALVNAASELGGTGAPNAVLTAYGSFPSCGANAAVSVDGSPTTVFYSSGTQINFLLPASVATEETAYIEISCGDGTIASLSLAVSDAAPALFTATATGTGSAAVVNQDGSIDTAAPAGSVIQLYGTGFGLLEPSGADGLSHLARPVTAMIGGVSAQVLFAGQSPGFTPGLQQVNVVVPSGIKAAAAVPISLSVDGVATQAAVTIGVR
jgi:uncharacterized protein (TIGR03437 family)